MPQLADEAYRLYDCADAKFMIHDYSHVQVETITTLHLSSIRRPDIRGSLEGLQVLEMVT